MKQIGVDYTDIPEVNAYDERMKRLRDIKGEIEDIITRTCLTENQTILEFGTGTGELAVGIAKHCKTVIALDTSSTMLEFARQKANNEEILNIEFFNAGFLTYVHSREPLDVVVSQLALHHLPDFWKLIALKKVHSMLKEGGKFYLRDTVYSFNMDNYKNFFDNWIKGIRSAGGDELALDTEIAIAEEYSTIDWIMEGIIRQAGFKIDEIYYDKGFIAIYLCSKPRK